MPWPGGECLFGQLQVLAGLLPVDLALAEDKDAGGQAEEAEAFH